jgi:hypothetical protein
VTFPTTAVLDNTTRANENPLSNGGRWAGPIVSGHAVFQLVANAVQVNTALFSIGDEYWSVATFGPNSEAYATLSSFDTVTSGSVYFLYTNIQTPGAVTPGYYSFRFETGSTGSIGNAQLSRNGVGGWVVVIGAIGSVSPAQVGDGFGLRVNGRIVEAWYRRSGVWAMVASANDAALSGTTALPAGYIGVGLSFPGVSPAVVTWQAFGGGTAVISFVSRLPLLGAG